MLNIKWLGIAIFYLLVDLIIRKLYMKRVLYVVLMFVASLTASAQVQWTQAYQDYIDKYKDMAIEQMLRHRIPASITLAQGLLESAAGRSKLATYGNNHFGIKCHDWTGRTMRKDDDAPNECFRVYDSPRESFEDHSLFLQKKRYESLFSLQLTDYKGWAQGLKACGYATNPVYAQTLISIIESYKLYEYDTAKTYVGSNSHGKMPAGTAEDRKYQLYSYNNNYYVVAYEGDTFAEISEYVGVSASKLAKYNERNRNDVLSQGDVVYLYQKQTRAKKEYENRPHTVRAGESLYSIAQLYGIRLRNLYIMNRLDSDYSPRVGDQLRVY